MERQNLSVKTVIGHVDYQWQNHLNFRHYQNQAAAEFAALHSL